MSKNVIMLILLLNVSCYEDPLKDVKSSCPSSVLNENQTGVCEGSVAECRMFDGLPLFEDIYTSVEGYEETETSCDGLDNDCDGVVDEALVAPPANQQFGVCEGSVKVCDVRWKDPAYGSITGFSPSELCDGIDNDCDGQVDENIDMNRAPLADNQAGVCMGSQKQCSEGQWIEPMYAFIDHFDLIEKCDGLDNDCDGVVDEALVAPLSDVQDGVCVGVIKVCGGFDGWVEPDYGTVSGFEMMESVCDGVDSDCDGVVDEDLVVPPADLQDGVCNGLSKVSCDGVNGWMEPNYESMDGYLVEDVACDGVDNDCDGGVDEGGVDVTEEFTCGVGACVRIADVMCLDGARTLDSCTPGDPVGEICGDGVDNDCDGEVDEIEGEICGDGVDNDCDGEVDCPCDASNTGCPDLDFVSLTGGSFSMGGNSGNSNEQPVHNVTVGSFDIMRTELTVAQYRLCVNAGACSVPNCNNSNTSGGVIVCNYSAGRENHPVNYISWFQANEYAEWAVVRLPTEAEWEYAARGQGQNVTYPWGEVNPTCSYADMYYNSSYCNGSGTSSVCNTPAGNTAQGLCDMAGNVYEWVQDEYHRNYNGAPNDGSGWCTTSGCPVNTSNNTYRVVRGGGWNSSAYSLRVANRNYYTPTFQGNNLGVRFCRSNN